MNDENQKTSKLKEILNLVDKASGCLANMSLPPTEVEAIKVASKVMGVLFAVEELLKKEVLDV